MVIAPVLLGEYSSVSPQNFIKGMIMFVITDELDTNSSSCQKASSNKKTVKINKKKKNRNNIFTFELSTLIKKVKII